MEKEALKKEAIKFLNLNMVEDDYIGSAVFALFEEALKDSTNKTQLMKTFRRYCNQELGRSYLIGDVIYSLLKFFINQYKIMEKLYFLDYGFTNNQSDFISYEVKGEPFTNKSEAIKEARNIPLYQNEAIQILDEQDNIIFERFAK